MEIERDISEDRLTGRQTNRQTDQPNRPTDQTDRPSDKLEKQTDRLQTDTLYLPLKLKPR